MCQVSKDNSIDWKMLITINIPERPWARISPCGLGYSVEQTKELAPALLLFSGLFWMPQWTRTFLFGSRAWKWYPEDLKWPLAEALEGAPESQPARDSPSVRPGSSTQPGHPASWQCPSRQTLQRCSHTHRTTWEEERDSPCFTALPPTLHVYLSHFSPSH